MLNKIKLKNEEIISNYLQNAFGDGFKIKTNWGFPVTRIIISSDSDSNKSTWELTLDLLVKSFNLRTINSKIEEGLEIAEWGSIDSSTINYVIDTTIAITEQLFITRPQEEVNPEETENENEIEAVEPDEIFEA